MTRKQFDGELSIRSDVYGIGSGRSKKEAEQQTARAAMEKLSKLRSHSV